MSDNIYYFSDLEDYDEDNKDNKDITYVLSINEELIKNDQYYNIDNKDILTDNILNYF